MIKLIYQYAQSHPKAAQATLLRLSLIADKHLNCATKRTHASQGQRKRIDSCPSNGSSNGHPDYFSAEHDSHNDFLNATLAAKL